MRRTGVIVYRQIASEIRREIADGAFRPGERLPNEETLAARYGVNRHTLRQAIASLAEQGIVTVRHGKGTFVRPDTIEYPLTSRTRFTEIISKQNRSTEGRVIRLDQIPATDTVAESLDLRPGAPLLLLEVLASIDGRPFSVCEHHFPLPRFEGLAQAYEQEGSITGALSRLGVRDYFRRTTQIRARLPTIREAKLLKQARGQPVILTEAVNVDESGRPIELGISAIAADRIQFLVET